MIAKTWELHCDLSALDELTCKIAMHETEDASPEFCAALGAFRKVLISETEKVGAAIERMVDANLKDKGRARV